MSELKPIQERPLISLFKERMILEGNGQERLDLIAKYRLGGMAFMTAILEMQKDMGAGTLEEEREMAEDREAGVRDMSLADQLKIAQSQVKSEQAMTQFEGIVRKLPPTAPVPREIDWIRSHPAMSRFNRQTDKTKPILIRTYDVVHGADGPAPSQAAVTQLQHWCNRPHEFFKQLITEHKKKGEDPNAEQHRENMDDLSEVAALLDQVESQAAQPVTKEPAQVTTMSPDEGQEENP